MERTVWEIDWRKVGVFVAALMGAAGIALYGFNLSWIAVLILGILGFCVLIHFAGMYGARSDKPGENRPMSAAEHASPAVVVNMQSTKAAVVNSRHAKTVARQARARAYGNGHGSKGGGRKRSGGKHDCCG